jgi:hypothetical protein
MKGRAQSGAVLAGLELEGRSMRSHMAHTRRLSVQRQSNSRGWLHRVFPCKRHQMRHLCDLFRLLAKQMLSQLSYTPILVTTLF